jgi:hypothetical protein
LQLARPHRQQTVFGSTLYPDTAIEPWLTVDPTDPSRFLVGHDRFSPGSIPVDSIAFSQSLDRGATWSTPIRINSTPPNAPPAHFTTRNSDLAVRNFYEKFIARVTSLSSTAAVVARLHNELNRPELHDKASAAIRSLIEEVRLVETPAN